MIRFNSDYTEGCHPAILQKLAETNMEQTAGYGEDEYCEQARELIRKYFEPADGEWRGLGVIPGGNRALRQKYSRFDAMNRFEVLKQPLPSAPDRGCRCGEVLTGRLAPEECPLYDKICTPEHPVGACMVSVEGACAASWYNRGRC